MDLLSWIPTPLRPSPRTPESGRKKQRGTEPNTCSLPGRPLVFHVPPTWTADQPHACSTSSEVMLGMSRGAHDLSTELIATCKDLAARQLLPGGEPLLLEDTYRGPITLLKEAYTATESSGRTQVSLALLDNSTVIHGKLHPMLATLSLGGCELLQLRRPEEQKSTLPHIVRDEASSNAYTSAQQSSSTASGRSSASTSTRAEKLTSSLWVELPLDDAESPGHRSTHSHVPEECGSPEGVKSQASAQKLEIVLHAPSERHRHASTRDEAVLERSCHDTSDDTADMLERMETDSSVLCSSARQGDIVVLLSEGHLSDTAVSRIATLCNDILIPTAGPRFVRFPSQLLELLARRIADDVLVSRGPVIVAEVVEWAPDESACSSTATTPAKILRAGSYPVLEGHEDSKSLGCRLGFGDYAVSLHAEVPKLSTPKKEARKSRHLPCDLASL